MKPNSVTVATGAYPTSTPTVLTSTIAIERGASLDVDAMVKVASGTDTFRLLGWMPRAAVWVPLATLSSDSSATGGVVYTRVTPGSGLTHFMLWRDGGTVTAASAYINTDIMR